MDTYYRGESNIAHNHRRALYQKAGTIYVLYLLDLKNAFLEQLEHST